MNRSPIPPDVLKKYMEIIAKAGNPPQTFFFLDMGSKDGDRTVISLPPRAIYIFARDLHAARLYAQLVLKIPRNAWRYVGIVGDLYGVRNAEVHVVTTWQDHDRAWEIRDLISELEKRGYVEVKEVEW